MSIDEKVFEHLKQLLRSKGISNVAIIDDAYYKIPSRLFFAGPRLGQLRSNIQAWDKPSKEFEALQLKIDTDDDLTDEAIQKIYELRAGTGEIQKWFQDYENEQEQRRAGLRELEEMLRNDLGCAVQTLSPAAQFDAANLPQLIFVDYYLDPSDRPENSLVLAEALGQKIASSFAPTDKPFVILMSSKTTVDGPMKAMFREKADFIGGMFYFIPKSDLKRNPTFLIRLAILMRSVDEGRIIQQFVEAFGAELLNAAQRFKSKVRSLSIEDYGYMQQLSLYREGRPLGDYLLWLFGSYFGHLLFRSVPEQRRQLDSMNFSDVPESDSFPSEEFVDLYKNVVAQEVQELGIHPRSQLQNGQDQTLLPPDPHFGDLFINEKKEVLMIITPECDLLFAPEAEAQREHRPDQSVLMVPGKLEELGRAHESTDVVTSFFPLDERTHQIKWSIKSAESPHFEGLRSFLHEGGYKRRSRIRHPFSTEVQDAFTRDISRVAMPVAPPMLRKASVVICCQGEGDKVDTTDLESPSAIIFATHDEDYVHLKLQTAVKVIEEAQAQGLKLQAKLTAETTENVRKRLVSHIERLNKLVTDLDAQIKLRQPHAVKLGKSCQISGTPVELVREASKESIKIKQRLSSSPIIVLVIEDDPQKETVTTSSDPARSSA